MDHVSVFSRFHLHFFEVISSTQSMTYNTRKHTHTSQRQCLQKAKIRSQFVHLPVPLIMSQYPQNDLTNSWGPQPQTENPCCLGQSPVWRCYLLLSSSRHAVPEMSSDPGIKQQKKSRMTHIDTIKRQGLYTVQCKLYEEMRENFRSRLHYKMEFLYYACKQMEHLGSFSISGFLSFHSKSVAITVNCHGYGLQT